MLFNYQRTNSTTILIRYLFFYQYHLKAQQIIFNLLNQKIIVNLLNQRTTCNKFQTDVFHNGCFLCHVRIQKKVNKRFSLLSNIKLFKELYEEYLPFIQTKYIKTQLYIQIFYPRKLNKLLSYLKAHKYVKNKYNILITCCDNEFFETLNGILNILRFSISFKVKDRLFIYMQKQGYFTILINKRLNLFYLQVESISTTRNQKK
eukprot:TRINITY_DN4147_c0_g1_i5.p1 TRINITY_DN4147_c0_g1~~TRINITY_DN4147_c0_g1_i5.p1  ORF type:complete len:204 (-),score=-10.83 TRINITY_DN4147_c0_g1_i5:379-990(-)